MNIENQWKGNTKECYGGILFNVQYIIRFDVDSPEKLCFENKTKFGKK